MQKNIHIKLSLLAVMHVSSVFCELPPVGVRRFKALHDEIAKHEHHPLDLNNVPMGYVPFWSVLCGAIVTSTLSTVVPVYKATDSKLLAIGTGALTVPASSVMAIYLWQTQIKEPRARSKEWEINQRVINKLACCECLTEKRQAVPAEGTIECETRRKVGKTCKEDYDEAIAEWRSKYGYCTKHREHLSNAQAIPTEADINESARCKDPL